MKGIYQIKNRSNGKVYIGSSNNINKRWNQHVLMLFNKIHHSYILQEDFNEYGIEEFDFSILKILNYNDNILSIEQEFIDEVDISLLYNVMLHTSYKTISTPSDLYDSLNYVENIDEIKVAILKRNINIYQKSDSFLKIGSSHFDLSKSWFLKTDRKNVEKLKNSNLNFIMNKMKAKSKELYWTTFVQQFKVLNNNGMTRSFIPINSFPKIETDRRNILVFSLNCFPNSFMKNAIEMKIDDEKYALSVILKWIISVSDIEKEINIYIPSSRMEKILRNWINN